MIIAQGDRGVRGGQIRVVVNIISPKKAFRIGWILIHPMFY